MFIRSLSLTNILSFSAQALELKPLNILIGANGSGKSNLIDCLEFLHALPNDLGGFINRRGGTEAWVWKGTHQLEHAVRIACEFRLENLELRYEIEISAVSRVLEIAAESLIGVGTIDDTT